MERYTVIKYFENHRLLFDNISNSLVLLKRYDKSQKEVLEKLKLICNDCNIPKILEVKIDEEIVTLEQFIEGVTLEDHLEDIKVNNIVISYDFFCNFLTSLYFILKKLKAQSIVHRDIKMSNIIINEKKEVYLIDFNISRIYDSKKDNDTTLFGTQGYAAPEQYGFSQTNFKSDIYSLGKVLEQIYMFMDKDYKIENLITNMVNIDFNKRASLDEIEKFLVNLKKVKRKGVDYIPYYMPFENNIFNITYNFFILYFIIYMNMSFINDIPLTINSKIIIILINIEILFLYKFLHEEFKTTKIYAKINNLKTGYKIVVLALYGFLLLCLIYMFLWVIFEFLNNIFV